MVQIWILQIIGMVLTLGVLQIMQRRAFMRGLKGTPMHDNWFKLLKLTFLVCWLGPPVLWLDRVLDLFVPFGSLFLLAYGYTFADLSEVYGGRIWTPLRQSKLALSMASYFPVQVSRKTPRLDPAKRYIFAAHPHGILPFGCLAGLLQPGPQGFAGLFPEVPDLRFLVSSFTFYIPFFRDFLLSIGAIDASRFSASRTLRRGSSLLLFPGGASEALYCSPKSDVLLLSMRTGFIKLALEFGIDIVPVYTFNENNAYEQLNADSTFIRRLKGWFQSVTGMSLPLLCHLFPRRAPMMTVYGEPIKIPKISGASEAVASKYLQIYTESLKALYRAHMKQYNVPNDKPDLSIL